MTILLGSNGGNSCADFAGVDVPFNDFDGTMQMHEAVEEVARAVTCYHQEVTDQVGTADDYVYLGGIVMEEIHATSDNLTPAFGHGDGDLIYDYEEMYVIYAEGRWFNEYDELVDEEFILNTFDPLPSLVLNYDKDILNFYYDTHVGFIERLRAEGIAHSPYAYTDFKFMKCEGAMNFCPCDDVLDAVGHVVKEYWELTTYYYAKLTYVSTPVREDIAALQEFSEPLMP